MLMKQTTWCKVWDKLPVFALTAGIILFVCGQHSAQPAVSARSLLVEAGEDGNLYYTWYAGGDMPFMRAAKWLDITNDDIRHANQIPEKQELQQVKKLHFPVRKEKMTYDLNTVTDKAGVVQIWYRVKKGETLYRIARKYAGCSMAQLTSNNQKAEWRIAEGEKVLLGWINTGTSSGQHASPAVPDAVVKKTTQDPMPVTVAEKETEAVPTVTEATEKEVVWVEEEVIGGKVKHDAGANAYFVLHNGAKPGSQMTLYYPMLKKKVKAKVLGSIPAGTYREEVQVLLSKATARALGIIDFRFKVVITFEAAETAGEQQALE